MPLRYFSSSSFSELCLILNKFFGKVKATKNVEKENASMVRKSVASFHKSETNTYRRSTQPTSVPLTQALNNSFPLSFMNSVKDYGLRKDPLKIQHNLLSSLPFYLNTNANEPTGKIIETKLDSGHYINEFVIYPPNKNEADEGSLNHLIMVHGYGAGLGFFLKNFEIINGHDNWCIHAIDLLGYGCSSRPRFKLAVNDIDHVERWFHDSFDSWLEKRGLKNVSSKTIIMAHSMGAYLMATYGIKVNPDFCSKLIMVSPGAVAKNKRRTKLPKYFAKLWELNASPFLLVRGAGPLGSKLVSAWTYRRFAGLSHEEVNLLHKYTYTIFQAPASGEYMLNYLLAPGADARHPLMERGIEKLNCEVIWCYGKEDWMEKWGSYFCRDLINKHHRDETKSKVIEIENSGHHLYLDNYKKFNDLLADEMSTL